MTSKQRSVWLASLVVVAWAVLTGCGPESPGQVEPSLESSQSPITASGTPDLWVSSVSGPSSIATAGSGFSLTVAACNQGAGSTSSTVKLYLSADTVITPTDTLVGSAATGTLHPSQCTLLHVPIAGLSALPSGQRYVGAIIDPDNTVTEASETNNTRSGNKLAFGPNPDFSIARVSAPLSLLPSEFFEPAVTVCNEGTTAGSSMVAIYLSADSTLTADDTKVGHAPTGTLSAGQCTTLLVRAQAQVPPGQWYVGAWVDVANEVAELREGNNTRVGSRSSIDSRPDLTVSAVSGPVAFSSASPLTLTATVCNQGRAAVSSQVEFYLSSDNILTPTDALLGSASISDLEPGRCSPVSFSGPTSVGAGRWYAGAWVDRANTVNEAVEDNNTRIGDRPARGDKPDLVVTDLNGPSSAVYAQPVATSATVCNQGTTPSAGTHLSFFLSSDTAITAADTLLGKVPVPGLQVGECAPVEASGPANVTDGPWYVGAWVDPDGAVAELVENNNTQRVSDLLGVGEAADLTISRLTSRPVRALIEARLTVCNQGTRPSLAPSRVSLYASSDAAVASWDFFLGEASLPVLLAGRCTDVTLSTSSELPEGMWYVGAIVDRSNTEPELQEDNNTRVGNFLMWGAFPDYVVSLHAPASLLPGQPFTARMSVCNQGSLDISLLSLTLHASADVTVTREDLELGSVGDFSHALGGCLELQVTSAGLPEGTWYLGAIVEQISPIIGALEPSRDNNTSVTPVHVGARPDLVLSRLTGPTSISVGQALSATATVCNQGTASGVATSLVLHFSRDGLITATDRSGASAAVPALQPNDCADIPVVSTALNLPEGLWTLGARIDPGNTVPELREDNNAGAGNSLAVGTQADLFISRFSAPTNAPQGQAFKASLTVCNQGTAPSAATQVGLFFSVDATLTHQDLLAGGAPLPPLEPGQCRDVSVQATASASSGLWYFGALADSTRTVPELREGDNAHVVERFILGQGQDLAITKLEAPHTVGRFESFELSATVCNQGTQLSESTTVGVLQLASGDLPEDVSSHWGFDVEPLEPGQCRTVEADYLSIWEPGTWRLGVRLEPEEGSTPPELRTDNDTRLLEYLTFVVEGVDLMVKALTTPPNVAPGQSFPVTATVCNPGTEPSSDAQLTLRYSADALITQYDPLAGSASVGPLSAGECRPVSLQLVAPSSGRRVLGVTVTSTGGSEARTDNNLFVSEPLVVGQAPDLAVTQLRVPETLSRLTQAPVDITVCNQGTASGGSTSVALFFSTDASPGADVAAGSAAVPALAAGACATLSAPASVTADNGPWYFGARVGQGGSELRPENNSRFVQTVIGDGRDLAVRYVSTTTDPELGPGVTVTVCNQGSQASSGGEIELFLSDPLLVPSSYPLVSVALPELAPGECTTRFTLEGYMDDGLYLLGARVFGSCCGPEVREDNDTLIQGLPEQG
jgi:subtilase family serine protease